MVACASGAVHPRSEGGVHCCGTVERLERRLRKSEQGCERCDEDAYSQLELFLEHPGEVRLSSASHVHVVAQAVELVIRPILMVVTCEKSRA